MASPRTIKLASVIGGLAFLALLGLAAVWYWPPRETAEKLDPWFEDVTDAAGIDFVHDAGDLGQYLTIQQNGSGVALFDFDGDGKLDIYLLTLGGPDSPSTNRLYKNMGNGTFKDVTAGSGLGIKGINTGVAIGDINNDGKPDVVVTQYGGIKLFLNKGGGKFEDITAQAGLENPGWATSAAFVDYNKDGFLDLVVANYVDYDKRKVCVGRDGLREFCGPAHFNGTPTRLFRNLTGRGEGIRFEDVTLAAGLAKAPGPGLGVYCADFNGDGLPDIFIANDQKPNHLWINHEDGTFTEEASFYGLAVDGMGNAQAGMGIGIGDVDGDGRFDIFISHTRIEYHTLWLQKKRGMFQDATSAAGLMNAGRRSTGFGTAVADFDNDGWPDIVLANGGVARDHARADARQHDFLTAYGERNQLFRNLGSGTFRDISDHNPALCGTPNVARGLAYGDLHGDGALDLVLTTIADRARVFRNVAKSRGNWLMVQAFDPRLNRDAYGAELVVKAGDRSLLRIVNPSDSYQSSNDPRAHFGLGAATGYDSIQVLWPDGLREEFTGEAANRVRKLERGRGKKLGGTP